MRNLVERKERYMRDPLPIRLGGLAANLARVRSFSRNEANHEAVFDLLEESKYFIEWTATAAEMETTLDLIELQLQIAVWQKHWQRNWDDENIRDKVAEASANWSRNLLERSGLLG